MKIKTNNMTKIEQIYTDYIKAKVLAESVKSVALKHNCTPRYVYYVVQEVEKEHVYTIAENMRRQAWLYRYQRVMFPKSTKKIQHALIRYLYWNKGYDINDIAECTKYRVNNVRIVLWG